MWQIASGILRILQKQNKKQFQKAPVKVFSLTSEVKNLFLGVYIISSFAKIIEISKYGSKKTKTKYNHVKCSLAHCKVGLIHQVKVMDHHISWVFTYTNHRKQR